MEIFIERLLTFLGLLDVDTQMHTLLDQLVSFGGGVSHVTCNLVMLAAQMDVNLDPQNN